MKNVVENHSVPHVVAIEVHQHPEYGWRLVYWAADHSVYDVVETADWTMMRKLVGRQTRGFRVPTERQLYLNHGFSTRDDSTKVWNLERAS